jgi:ribokinase
VQNFRKVRVDATHVQVTAGVASGVAPITVDERGNNSILIVPGANDRLTPADVQAAMASMKNIGALLTQLEVLHQCF